MLTCPNCGAAAAPGDVACGYCRVQLQTVACASCLGMIFVGEKFCPHCGARVFAVDAKEAPAATERRCPRCAHAMTPTAIGSAILEECSGCGGVWVDAQSFAELSRSPTEQAAYVGAGSPLPAPGGKTAEAHVQYVKCPDCGGVMNRVNFARWSGVIVDVCKRHGTWFDRDELRQIVEFIRSGGLDAAREKERRELDVERQRLKERERGGAALAVGDDGDFSTQFLRWLVRE